MTDLIRLVDETRLNAEGHCTFCANATGPFLELLLPSPLVGAADFGAVYLCGSCFEASCAAGGVVSKERFEAVLERAQEAEQLLADAHSSEKQLTATVAKLEAELAKAQTEAQVAREQEQAAQRRIDELAADPAVLERDVLLARIQAAAVEDQPRGRKQKTAA
jgi:hypothetical protein